MIPDDDDPRKGSILLERKVVTGGPNFEFCNGERVSVDLSTLVVADADCKGMPTGPFTVSAENLLGASVYSNELEVIGEVTDLVSYKDGQAPMVIVGVGGFLGLGEKPIEIDLDPLTSSIQLSETGEYSVILRQNTSEEIENREMHQPK